MNTTIYIIAIMVICIGWLLPAIYLTKKVKNIEGLNPKVKKYLITQLWMVPFIGNFICYISVARLGPLPKLTESEHRSFWSGFK